MFLSYEINDAWRNISSFFSYSIKQYCCFISLNMNENAFFFIEKFIKENDFFTYQMLWSRIEREWRLSWTSENVDLLTLYWWPEIIDQDKNFLLQGGFLSNSNGNRDNSFISVSMDSLLALQFEYVGKFFTSAVSNVNEMIFLFFLSLNEQLLSVSL